MDKNLVCQYLGILFGIKKKSTGFRFQLGREAGVVNLGREVTNRERGGSEGPAVGRGQAVLRGTRAGVGTGWQEAES